MRDDFGTRAGVTATGPSGFRQDLHGFRAVPVHGQLFETTPAAAAEGYQSYLASHPRHADACAGTLKTWRWMDPLWDAAEPADLPGLRAADLRSYFCTPKTCPAVIGSVVVYFDASHMTATYGRTLAPPLDREVQAALRG